MKTEIFLQKWLDSGSKSLAGAPRMLAGFGIS
jgi:hypothetical protein